MKTKTLSLAVLLCAALCISSASFAKDKKATGGGEDQIKALLDQSRQAALKGDSSYLEQNASDDYVRVTGDGKLLTKSEMIAAFKNGDVKYQSIDTSDVKVRLHGDAAVSTVTADVKGTNKGQDISGRTVSTRFFVKRGGKWQEVAHTTTKVAQ